MQELDTEIFKFYLFIFQTEWKMDNETYVNVFYHEYVICANYNVNTFAILRSFCKKYRTFVPNSF